MRLNNPFLAGLCDGIEALNTTSAETSLEMIAEKQPDLIITITEADYDKYAKIAPTVYIADGTRTDEDLFRYIASTWWAKKDAAEAYIAEFNDKVATVKDEMVGIVGDRTVSILEVWPQEIYVMGSHFARGGSILYDRWGLKAPEAIQGPMVDGDEAYEVISVEALPDYAGDFICYGVLDGADSALRGRLAAVEEPARRAGRARSCPTSRWPSCTATPSRSPTSWRSSPTSSAPMRMRRPRRGALSCRASGHRSS